MSSFFFADLDTEAGRQLVDGFMRSLTDAIDDCVTQVILLTLDAADVYDDERREAIANEVCERLGMNK